MLTSLRLPLTCTAALVASPGPATLAIADTFMKAGRRVGLALVLGSLVRKPFWSPRLPRAAGR
ncbi:MAG: hypothetical protein PGN34_04740 [Methylobacterium frigidaeris]